MSEKIRKAEGTKNDKGKLKIAECFFHLFPNAIKAVTEISMQGAEEYGNDNWIRLPEGEQRITNALSRHFLEEVINKYDEKSGRLHASHVAWNALARLEIMLRKNRGNLNEQK